VVLLVGRERIGAVCRRGLRGANCAAAIARRDLRCAMYAARSCAARTDAARLNSNPILPCIHPLPVADFALRIFLCGF